MFNHAFVNSMKNSKGSKWGEWTFCVKWCLPNYKSCLQTENEVWSITNGPDYMSWHAPPPAPPKIASMHEKRAPNELYRHSVDLKMHTPWLLLWSRQLNILNYFPTLSCSALQIRMITNALLFKSDWTNNHGSWKNKQTIIFATF